MSDLDLVVKKHFVTFMSPGTFVSETTTKEIGEWNVEQAMQMARDIKERHGATPYGFYFSTRGRKADELDSREICTSKKYYLGGKVETQEEIIARNLPDENILRSNMRNNGIKRIITNTNSYKIVQPLDDDDVVLQWP